MRLSRTLNLVFGLAAAWAIAWFLQTPLTHDLDIESLEIYRDEAYKAIQWKVVFLLGGVLALGMALEKTGAALYLANLLVTTLGSWGPTALVSAFYLMTSLMTELMSNNATAALLTPIAIATADWLGVDSRPFLMAVAYAASAAFMTRSATSPTPSSTAPAITAMPTSSGSSPP